VSESGGTVDKPRRQLPAGLPALLGGIGGGTLLTLLGVPAGGIVGAVVGSAAVSAVRARQPLSGRVRLVGMLLLGCAAGARLEPASLRALLWLAVPLLVSLGLLIGVNVLLAFLLNRRYRIDLVTALLACAPGGLSEIAVVAEEVGARSGIVIAVHVVRVITVVVFTMPLLMVLLEHA
jgi:uncharacterized protein